MKAFPTKARWFGTPPALAELLQELAFARCDVSIVGGITSMAVMIIVAPNRRFIFFISYLSESSYKRIALRDN